MVNTTTTRQDQTTTPHVQNAPVQTLQNATPAKSPGRRSKLKEEEVTAVRKYINDNAKSLQQQMNAGRGRELLMREAVKNGVSRKLSLYQWARLLSEAGLKPQRTGDAMRYISGRSATNTIFAAMTSSSADPSARVRNLVAGLDGLTDPNAKILASEIRRLAKDHDISLVKRPQPTPTKQGIWAKICNFFNFSKY